MRLLTLLIFLLFSVNLLNAQQLVLKIENLSSLDGQLIITLFNNSKDFLKNPVYEKYIDIDEAHMTIALNDVPSGDYGLCVVHDENGNGDIDTNVLKIPKESYGFSLNPKSRFGPPKFDQTKFSFKQNLELTVMLN